MLIYNHIIGTNAGSHGTCYLVSQTWVALEGSSRAGRRMTAWNLSVLAYISRGFSPTRLWLVIMVVGLNDGQPMPNKR